MISLKVILQAHHVVFTDLITGFDHGQALKAVPTTLGVQVPSLALDRLVAPVVPELPTTPAALELAPIQAVIEARVTSAAVSAVLETAVLETAALETAARESITRSTAATTVKTAVVTTPPGAAEVKVVTSSTNQTSSSAGVGAVDPVTGGGGPVDLTVRFGDSPIPAPQRIRDVVFGQTRMALRSAEGTLQPLPRSFSRAANNSTATTLRQLAAAVFADADGLQAGNQALRRGAAALVRATNAEIRGTYLLVNNGSRGLDPADDLLIRLSGLSGRLPALGAIDPASFFA